MALSPLGQDRLVAKEVALGVIRELQPPQDHIGLRLIAPFLDVESDDVIFQYVRGLSTGLAPARAEDAESELAQKDFPSWGLGRASVIDWALKDHYDPSDISRYREALILANGVNGTLLSGIPLFWNGRMIEEFQGKLARDDTLRRNKLDNRLEWLIMTALETGGITYNDGKIKFTVDYGRPGGQQDQPVSVTWDQADSDPIGDAIRVKNYMYDTYLIEMDRVIMSRWTARSIINSNRFAARTGLVLPGSATPSTTPVDPFYLLNGWNQDSALQAWAAATGLTPIIYDSVYRTRNIGSNTFVNNRFTSNNKLIYLPSEASVNLTDDAIGFAKTLTSPHPEGNWTPGYYEWEKDTGPDPWGYDRGTGIKAFPVFTHMNLTYVQTVLPTGARGPF